MTLQATAPSAPSTGKGLRIGLWVAQTLVALTFCAAGFAKLTIPIPQLSAMMPWTGELPVAFVRTLAVIDLAGGIGILLPALSRIQPRLTVTAAIGCIILQVLASLFHISRGEFSVLPLNAVLLALLIFILWNRVTKAPIGPRR